MKLPSFVSNPFDLLGGLDEASWKKKTFYVFLFALLAWGAAFSFWSDGEELRARRTLHRSRFNELVAVLREYSALKSIGGGAKGGEAALAPVAGGDLLSVVSDVVGSLGLRTNMISLSTASVRGGRNGVSISLEGLSAENLAMFLQEMDRRGIETFSADLRAVRENEKQRTLTVFLLLGGAS